MSKLGSGERFAKLSGSVSAEYRKKGKSVKEAKMIGRAIAAKVGMAKYGKQKMMTMAEKGQSGWRMS